MNNLKFVIFTIIAAVLIIGFNPSNSYANGDMITVLNQTIESDFPHGIKFYLEATGPDTIDDIRVYFRKMGQAGDSGYRIVDFENGNYISGESTILSNKDNQYIAPGTRIEYYYDIRDVTGRVLETDPKVYTYLDHRFEWATVTDGTITVFYFGEGSLEKAEQILDICKATLDQMGPILGIQPTHPLHIVTYQDYSDMETGLPFRSNTVSKSLVTQGIAFADERTLLIYTANNFVGTTKHEFTHLLVGDAAGRAYNRVPLWLNEGLAEYANTDGSYQSYLTSAIQNGDLLPLWQRETFSGTPRDMMIGYGQGESVVQFMIDEYGTEKIASLMANIPSSYDIDSALEVSHGFDQHGLDSLWRSHMGLPQLPHPDVNIDMKKDTPKSQITTEPSPTIDYNNSGNLHQSVGNYQAAVDDYTQAITIDAEHALAYSNRGLAHQAMGDYPAAIADYTQAITIIPDNPQSYNSRGNAHQSMGNHQDAIDDYTQVITIDSTNSYAYYNRGFILQLLRNYQAAIDDYTQAITIDSTNSYAYYNRGDVHQSVGNYQAAVDDYTQAITIDAEHALAYSNRGLAHQAMGDYPAAIADYTQAITIIPDNPQSYNSRGNAHQSMGNHQDAIDNYTQVITMDPEQTLAYSNRGLAHQSMGNHRNAVDDYTQVIRIDPDNCHAYYNRASSNADLENYQAAIDDYTLALKVNPDNHYAYFNRASSHGDLENYRAAVDDYTKAISIAPMNVSSYYNRGLSYQLMENYEEAINDYSHAINIAPDYVEAEYNKRIAVELLAIQQ